MASMKTVGLMTAFKSPTCSEVCVGVSASEHLDFFFI